ncbi:MAG TPA: hypothetical protein VKR24_10510 [Candidatus Limnocylindrales bacterium]|nr:hypothetical protein [Candidatus Limnocylindrales bacterium]
MTVVVDLLLLGAIVAIFLVLAVAAQAAGTDSRPGFGEDDDRFLEHHNSVGGSF